MGFSWRVVLAIGTFLRLGFGGDNEPTIANLRRGVRRV